MAASTLSRRLNALCGWRLEGAPGVEAAGEAVLLVPLPDQTQFPGVLQVLGAHVLDVNLQAEGSGEGGGGWLEECGSGRSRHSHPSIKSTAEISFFLVNFPRQ